MERLNFKKGVKSVYLSEDFFYMISDGGWLKPENFLEKEDVEKVRTAIDIIKKYEHQGITEGYFIEE